jgi:beta-lactamase regulating signal transducer with metallopeptidase domain
MCADRVVVETVTSSSASSTVTAIPSNSAPPLDSSSTSVGAIAGGVVGGVVGVALLVLLVWFVMRRKRKAKVETPLVLQERHKEDATETPKYRQTVSPTVYEVDGTIKLQNELPAPQKPVELPGSQG